MDFKIKITMKILNQKNKSGEKQRGQENVEWLGRISATEAHHVLILMSIVIFGVIEIPNTTMSSFASPDKERHLKIVQAVVKAVYYGNTFASKILKQ